VPVPLIADAPSKVKFSSPPLTWLPARANDTDDLTVLYQVATRPPKPSKISRYSYRGDKGVDPRTFEGDYAESAAQ